jgi:hypothetical protein
MESAFGVEHGGISKGLGGFLKPAGSKAGKAVAVAGKRRGPVTVTGGAQTGGKYRAGQLPYKGKHTG